MEKIHKCELILITKLYVDEKGETNLMFLRYSGKTRKFDNLKTLSDKGMIHDYFSTPVSAPIASLRITYMNSLLNLTCHEEGYQMSTLGPDSYVIKCEKIRNPMTLSWKLKDACSLLPVKRKAIRDMLPRRLKNSLCMTEIYIVTSSDIENKYIHDPSSKLFLIPYKIEKQFVWFAPITQEQYKKLEKLFKQKRNGLSQVTYNGLLDIFLHENGKYLLKIFIITQTKTSNGNIVCVCPNKLLLPRDVNLLDKQFKSLYVLRSIRNPSDFELPLHLICLLRSYPWPFKNELDENFMKLFGLTFTGKGLKRSCTIHEGNFEMIGERNSKQSTGSLLILPKKVDEHQYYRESMNLSLLPHAKNVIN